MAGRQLSASDPRALYSASWSSVRRADCTSPALPVRANRGRVPSQSPPPGSWASSSPQTGPIESSTLLYFTSVSRSHLEFAAHQILDGRHFELAKFLGQHAAGQTLHHFAGLAVLLQQ